MADYPRVILEGPTALENVRWRIVLCQKEDANGVPREVRFVEVSDTSDVDAMGCQRWRQLTSKSERSSWELVCGAAIDLALEKA